MRKIPTVFVRDEQDRRYVLPEVTSGCEWVLAGEGTPTRKYDGTCVRKTKDGLWWARREVKPGKEAPAGYVPEQVDDTTGKIVGWEPAEQSAFAKVIVEAVVGNEAPGTYELVGPKINKNPEGYAEHTLVPHAEAQPLWLTLDGFDPADAYEVVRLFVANLPYEGIVWHHPDGRMAKIKRRDFPRAVSEDNPQ